RDELGPQIGDERGARVRMDGALGYRQRTPERQIRSNAHRARRVRVEVDARRRAAEVLHAVPELQRPFDLDDDVSARRIELQRRVWLKVEGLELVDARDELDLAPCPHDAIAVGAG